jgi:hypothetical protein
MTTLTCLRCDHSWTNNTDEAAPCCPKCRNYNYDRPANKRRFANPSQGLDAMEGVAEPKPTKVKFRTMSGYPHTIPDDLLIKMREKFIK